MTEKKKISFLFRGFLRRIQCFFLMPIRVKRFACRRDVHLIGPQESNDFNFCILNNFIMTFDDFSHANFILNELLSNANDIQESQTS